MKKNVFLTILIFVIFSLTLIIILANVEPEKEPLKIRGAMNSLNFFTTQRAYPDKIIPADKYYTAYEYSKQNLNNNQDNPEVNPWQDIGPKNNGGRTNAVLINPVNPNTIYAGSASGGLWRSYSAGVGTNAWQYVSTGFPVLGVGAIAMNPLDTNTIYIGTGEVYGYQSSTGGLVIRTTRGSYGIGILKTTNNGVSWTKVLDWSYNQQRGVQVIKLNPMNPNIVWAGTTEGVYRSNNGGTSWTQISTVLMVTDILIHPTDTSRVMIACGNLGTPGTGLYRSTNSGASWVQMTNGLPASWEGKALYHFCKSQPNIVFASIGAGYNAGSYLCKTTNFGINWTVTCTTDYAQYQGWYSHFVVVNSADPSQVLAAGIDIWKSTDGGELLVRVTNWAVPYRGRVPIGGPEGPSYYSHADHHSFDVHPTNPNIVYFGTDGGIFRTTDFGVTFTGLNGGYQSTQFYNGFSSSTTDSLFSMGGLQDNSTCIYDGQPAWFVQLIGGDGCWTAINRLDNNTIYGSYQYLNILISHNKGNSFTPLSIPGGGNPSFAGPYVLGINNPQMMYVGKTLLFRSTDGGSTFSVLNGGNPLDGNPALSMAISHTNNDKLYVGTAPIYYRAGLFRTTDGGATFSNITGNLPDRYLVDIAVDPQNDSKVYVTCSGFGSSHLYKSTNSGNNWIDIGAGLPDVPTSAVAIDPMFPDHIYLGNDLGVYLSTNGGANWSSYSTGLPDACLIMDINIVPTSREVRIGSHGNGSYTRKLAGAIGIRKISSVVKDFQLEQNYPNPFNPSTRIRFRIGKTENVTLKIYDILGKEAAVLVDQKLQAGEYEIPFSVEQYNKFTSGVYFYRLEAGNFVQTKKMILLK